MFMVLCVLPRGRSKSHELPCSTVTFMVLSPVAVTVTSRSPWKVTPLSARS